VKRLRKPWFRVVADSHLDEAFYDERGVFDAELYGFFVAVCGVCRAGRADGRVTPGEVATLRIAAKRRNRLLQLAETRFLIMENPPFYEIRNWHLYQDSRLAKVASPEQRVAASERSKQAAYARWRRERETAGQQHLPDAQSGITRHAQNGIEGDARLESKELNPSPQTPPNPRNPGFPHHTRRQPRRPPTPPTTRQRRPHRRPLPHSLQHPTRSRRQTRTRRTPRHHPRRSPHHPQTHPRSPLVGKRRTNPKHRPRLRHRRLDNRQRRPRPRRSTRRQTRTAINPLGATPRMGQKPDLLNHQTQIAGNQLAPSTT
jgi:hypothetical protein